MTEKAQYINHTDAQMTTRKELSATTATIKASAHTQPYPIYGIDEFVITGINRFIVPYDSKSWTP